MQPMCVCACMCGRIRVRESGFRHWPTIGTRWWYLTIEKLIVSNKNRINFNYHGDFLSLSACISLQTFEFNVNFIEWHNHLVIYHLASFSVWHASHLVIVAILFLFIFYIHAQGESKRWNVKLNEKLKHGAILYEILHIR